MVTTTSHASGMAGIQAHLYRPFFTTTTRISDNAMAASSWLAIPNRGKSTLMPPSGSVTPMSRMAPHRAQTTMVEIQLPRVHVGSLKRRRPGMEPRESVIMKRATRVPASTVVRMNRASNMMAKWYQNAFMPAPPKMLARISDMPNARVGAPPVREITDASPTPSAASWIWAALRSLPGSPMELTQVAADSGVPPVSASGAFMTK